MTLAIAEGCVHEDGCGSEGMYGTAQPPEQGVMVVAVAVAVIG